MKKFIQIKVVSLSALLILSSFTFASNFTKDNNNIYRQSGTINNKSYKLNLSQKSQKKVGGLLLKRTCVKRLLVDSMKRGKTITRKTLDTENILGKINTEIIAIYLIREPSKIFEQKLKSLGVFRRGNVWVPAVGNHKHGFALFEAPIDKIEKLAEMSEIMRIASAERGYGAQLDKVPVSVGLDGIEETCTGGGITVGIIDTGYDVGNPDLPEPIAKWRYYYEEQIIITTNIVEDPIGTYTTNYLATTNNLVRTDTDADVSDYTSGHGTYIAGCIVGSGYLSEESGYSFNVMGVSTGTQVHVVKANTTNSIGIDVFREDILVQALMDLATSNCVDMINLSLGAWSTYHDGSSPLEQTIDLLAISYDIPVFCAAGNLADKKRHLILNIDRFGRQAVMFKTTIIRPIQISLNYVSADGFSVETEALDYVSTIEGGSVDLTSFPQTTSEKGVVRQRYEEQEWSLNGLTFGFFITNKISTNRFVHLYIDSYSPVIMNTEFQTASSDYTVTAPGNADRAFTVGATASRTTYRSIINPVNPSVGVAEGTVAPMSGRGPRVDLDPDGELMPADGTLEGVGSDYRFKPDFVCPGQFVFSLFDSNVRSNYLPASSYTDSKFDTPPPAYSLSPAGTLAWHFSLPEYVSDQRSFFTNDVLDNHILNYWCPQNALGNANITSGGNAGTSPASAIGVGCAAVILNNWPGFTSDELRRYMRPHRAAEAMPHKPGSYKTEDGFGALNVDEIFEINGYISNVDDCVVHFFSPTNDGETVRIVSDFANVSGTFYNVFNTENFILTNLLSGWSTNVDWDATIERAWWALDFPLSNYIKQVVRATFNSDDGCDADGCGIDVYEEIYIWRSHGFNPPTISVANPTDNGIVVTNDITEITLSGPWTDDSDIGDADSITIEWLNNTTLEFGVVTNVVATSQGQGTWSVTIPIEDPSYNKFYITATDDDGDYVIYVYVVDNGSVEYDVDKISFKVNLAKPLKDILKVQGVVKKTADDALFTVGMVFEVGLVQTNGVTTNLLSFVTTADNIKAKGRKAIYLDKGVDGHVFKVVASKKKNDDDIKLKITMKKFDGLEQILEIYPVDVKKKDSALSKEMMFKGEVCGFIFQSGFIKVPYWGKAGKNIIGKK